MPSPGEYAPGVGPAPEPWPDDPRLDPELLAQGDRRNVADRYRYWRLEAIVADLDGRRHPFHVAVENWQHDLNIGAVVRNANAFLAAEVHIVGERRWNKPRRDGHRPLPARPPPPDARGVRRVGGAVRRCPCSASTTCRARSRSTVTRCRERCVLLFGQEGPGLSEEARELSEAVLAIRQFGSTRSINAAAASAVAMHEWVRRWAPEE